MELRHLRYFTAVVEAAGFREASRRLHVAQAALSQTVGDLEAEIHVKLFTRRGRRSQLTRPGEVFYQEAKRTLQQADRAIAAAKVAERKLSGNVTIGFLPAATDSFLSEIIAEYKERNPSVEVVLRVLSPVKQLEAFAKGEVDLGFTLDPHIDQQTFASSELFRVPLIAVLPLSRAADAASVHLGELTNERFLVVDRSQSPKLFDCIWALCGNEGFSPITSPQPGVFEALQLVKANQGIAVLPAWTRFIAIDGVRFVRLLPDTARVELLMMWKRKTSSEPVRALVEMLLARRKFIQGRATHRLEL